MAELSRLHLCSHSYTAARHTRNTSADTHTDTSLVASPHEQEYGSPFSCGAALPYYYFYTAMKVHDDPLGDLCSRSG